MESPVTGALEAREATELADAKRDLKELVDGILNEAGDVTASGIFDRYPVIGAIRRSGEDRWIDGLRAAVARYRQATHCCECRTCHACKLGSLVDQNVDKIKAWKTADLTISVSYFREVKRRIDPSDLERSLREHLDSCRLFLNGDG